MGISNERKYAVLNGKLRFHQDMYYSYMVDVEIATELGLPALLAKATQDAEDTQDVIVKLQLLLVALNGAEDAS